MFSKFTYVWLFLALTVLHISAHLKPTFESRIEIKTISLELSRKLNMLVDYEYHHSMLWQAIVNSTLMIFGVWYCQGLDDKGKLRHQSSAAGSRLNWLQDQLAARWQLFRLRLFLLFALPWLATYILNGLLNYFQLNLVMRHFCTSPMKVVILYSRVQLLYMQRLLASLVAPYLLHFDGAYDVLTAAHTSHLRYESEILVGDD